MNRALVGVLIAASLTVIGPLAAPSFAGCGFERESYFINGVVRTRLVRVCSSEGTSASSPQALGPSAYEIAQTNYDAECLRRAELLGLDGQEMCLPAPEPGQITPDMVANAFADTPLPPSTLVIQPPNGRTLINFETNFYTEQPDFARALTLLGRPVQLQITAASFTWRFGDGESTTTTTPGAPYPSLDVTHEYRQPGTVHASVDTTYTAQYRVGGGGWAPVPGSVTIAGGTAPLQVLEARPTLVRQG